MAKSTVVELEHLRERLREAEETLSAIRNGDVDSLIVAGPNGDQVFSLKGAEQPYRVFLEQMTEGALTLTRDGTILYSNQRFAQLMRSKLERVIGAKFDMFVPPGDQVVFDEILKAPQGRKLGLMLSAADGTHVPAHLSFNILEVDDDVEAISIVVADMTEHEEKRELAAALNRLRTAQEQLQQQNTALAAAREASDSANEAKDNFLAALSHELRTPLAPVLNGISMLEHDASLTNGVKSMLAVIRRNVELEARLIDDLLDVTRIVRGKVEMKLELIDVHAVMSNAVEICHTPLTSKAIDLKQELNAKVPWVEGDGVRIQQILWNLLRNAVKFTPDNGRINVRTFNEGDTLLVEVSDTGIGIDDEAIKKIFIPFEQANRLITRQFGGLGLGLAISRRLAELHGGTVTAHSAGPGKGATFTLRLPTATAPRAQEVDRPATSAPSHQSKVQLRILLVEDHEDTRMSLAMILGRKHVVREAGSMASALDAVRDGPFDLVISDLGLPDGSGLELMRKLRSQFNLRGICLSGYGMEEDVSASAEAGFDHHLTKPVDFDKLEMVIDSLEA